MGAPANIENLKGGVFRGIVCGRGSKRPIDEGSVDNGRELQASWDRVLLIRVPLLVVSLLAQCLALLVASA
jgi:hypothetical protein